MSDDIQPRYVYRSQGARTWRRRKRTVIGKDWCPPGLQDVSAGLWCKKCHVRHPYNGRDKLGVDYECRNGNYTILWLCPITSDVLGELKPGEES
jgi:hypothetical protein